MASDTMPRRKAPRNDLTAEYVRSILDYDPETGVLTWKERSDVRKRNWNTRYAGKIAGTTIGNGRGQIRIHKRGYYSYRLAYLIQTGEWPPDVIDHRDSNADDRWKNLRPATQLQNMQNTKMRSHNTSGAMGVCWDKRRGKWLARVGKFHVGRFDRIEDAVAARIEAAKAIKGEFTHRDDLSRTFVAAAKRPGTGA